ncbi:zinc finger SWIM domain-containing protein 7-like [Sitodiplosis mosellana]|uniref:zinc finger SWIM domain-containing protein 7-like n=1 Tax=Sitodiplosis mosellana TaxID=263140 RepID=UPI002444A818|nr:zinc finger SWIM domain-containing protein 7-like [Sitodiplosis mosellana]
MELKPSTLAIIIHRIFDKLDTKYSLVHLTHIDDTDLLELKGIFGTRLTEALEIIDREQITIYRSAKSHREYFEISEDQNTVYKVLPNINYCMCTGFQEKVIHTNEQYTCKHVLAARIAGLIGKVKTETVANDVFTFSLQLIQATSLEPAANE